jgi:hypothetical protein
VCEAFLERSYLAEPDVLAGIVEPLLSALQAAIEDEQTWRSDDQGNSNGHF